ncbi:putative protein YbiB [uncultured Comamonas sp.]|nr:putative protein YbiB [uncultured Comamonas sp.]
MAIAHYIKEIGRGARGAKALEPGEAADLMGQLLDGQLNDLEIGAFCVAMRIKGETADEMCGFLDAVQARCQLLPVTQHPVVVLPSYNGARKLPVLTPLLALLLAREGYPVLLHGMRTEARRVLASDVLQLLDVQGWTEMLPLAAGQVAHVATEVLHPGLARLLAVRETLGLRTPGHSLVKLLTPCQGASVLVGSYTHPEYSTLMCEVLARRSMTGLISRGLEGEVVCDPRRQPRYDAVFQGQTYCVAEQQAGTLAEVSGLPTAIDAQTTADYTRAVLDGQLPVPQAVARQVAHIATLAQRVSRSEKA